jgi:fumarate hydratase, class I
VQDRAESGHIWKNSQLWSKVTGAEVAGLIGGMLFPEEARDIAHAKIKERLDRGEGMPDYMKDSMVYYAGPAKTPEGYASGSFGPTTAGRMDAYVDQFQSQGGSFVMLAKGNRSPVVTEACHKYGGRARRAPRQGLHQEGRGPRPELGMEAVFRIEVVDFPAFIVVDDKGNDFFAEIIGKKPRPGALPVVTP